MCDGRTSTGSKKIGWYACRHDSFRIPAIEVMFVELFHVGRGSWVGWCKSFNNHHQERTSGLEKLGV